MFRVRDPYGPGKPSGFEPTKGGFSGRFDRLALLLLAGSLSLIHGPEPLLVKLLPGRRTATGTDTPIRALCRYFAPERHRLHSIAALPHDMGAQLIGDR